MINAYLTVALSLVIGLSVFASMPILFNKKTSLRRMLIFNSAAIGILIFLLIDIYGNVAAIFGSSTLPNTYELVFVVGFALSFVFFIYPRESRDPDESPKRSSMLAAVGIGFQNLTEGLVFGSAGAASLGTIYIISLIGFSLQNMTEGFPIAAPLFGSKDGIDKKFITGAFLLGGLPTVIGTLIGLVYYSSMFIIFFDAMASAAILYIVLVLFHVNMKKAAAATKEISDPALFTYAGILAGFVIAFLVNYI